MKIQDVICVAGYSGFYFDDQLAIKNGAEHDGFFYTGDTKTKGFDSIRKAGETISVMIMTSDGLAGIGDCAAVQYSGAGGRDPLFSAEEYIPFIQKKILPKLIGRELDSFRELASMIDSMIVDGRRVHTAIRYGFSQALMNSVAKVHGRLPVEQLCYEYDLPLIPEPLQLFGQSGDDRYTGVDKMIIKGVDVMPHGLINEINTKLGREGELLNEYISWLHDRVIAKRTDSTYSPDLHLDVYGTIGQIFDYDIVKMCDYIAGLQSTAGEFDLYIEGPVDMGERPRQIEVMKQMTDQLAVIGSPVKLVADEWCNTFEDIKAFTDAKACAMVQIKTPDLGSIHNTIESVLYCKEHNMEAYQGGTCNETNISAIACVHAGLATRPDRMLIKPGMGFDEGYTIVKNEMLRTIAIVDRLLEQRGR